jgi:hypothetical protein
VVLLVITFKKGTALVPTFLASAVTGLMEKYFTDMDYEHHRASKTTSIAYLAAKKIA